MIFIIGLSTFVISFVIFVLSGVREEDNKMDKNINEKFKVTKINFLLYEFFLRKTGLERGSPNCRHNEKQEYESYADIIVNEIAEHEEVEDRIIKIEERVAG